MNKVIYLLLFILLSSSSITSQSDPRLKGVDKEMAEILELAQAAGFAVAVVEKDKTIYAKGFGYRDWENKLPADENTLFAIGSSSKAFTSAILGQLRNDEKLAFDDSPVKHVPELEFYNDELNNQVNIQDLMSHRTGIPRHDFSWYLFPTDDREELIGRIKHHEPFTGLRQQWYYNNFMFLTQGVIAERITGKSWEDNIKERFFEPLGMKRSNVSIDELEKSENASFGYGLQGDSLIEKMDYYHIAAMAPAGSINSSVADMSNWLKTWIQGGKFGDEEILPASYVNEAMSSHAVVHGGLPGSEYPDMHMANYGYGWFLSSYRGHYRVEHGGNIDGFSANVAFFPSDSIGIVVLANQNGSRIPGLVRNLMADRMLETGETDWVERYREQLEEAKKNNEEAEAGTSSSKVPNTRASHILYDYTGSYSNPGYGDFEIDLVNDSLIATFSRRTLYLRHYHYDVFEPFEIKDGKIDTSEQSPLKLNFTTNDAGDVSKALLKLEMTLDEAIAFKRTPKTLDVAADELEIYVGDYEFSGVTVKIFIKNEKTLYMLVPGQPEYEMIATGKHKFSFKALEGFKLEFIDSGDGSVNEVDIIQPNGVFRAKRVVEEEN